MHLTLCFLLFLGQEPGQRTFHIFYAVIKGATPSERQRHLIGELGDYTMTKDETLIDSDNEGDGQTSFATVLDDDEPDIDLQRMAEVRESLHKALRKKFTAQEGMSESNAQAAAEQEFDRIIRIVSAVLLLCNSLAI